MNIKNLSKQTNLKIFILTFNDNKTNARTKIVKKSFLTLNAQSNNRVDVGTNNNRVTAIS